MMLVDVIKSNRVLYAIAKAIKWFVRVVLIKHVLGFLFTLLPLKKNKIIASHFYGRPYGDSPAAIIDELIKRNKKLDIVWVLNDKNYNFPLPDGVRKVKEGSVRYMYEMATAKVWIDNVRKTYYPRKRRGQFYVQTWHGSVGLKMVEKDAPNLSKEYIKNAKKDSKIADLFLSGSQYVSNLYKTAFWYDGRILECGTPKLDIIVKRKGDAEYLKKIRSEVFKEIGVAGTPHVVMYAPTFRENSSSCYDLDYKGLVRALKDKFGGDWIVFLRFHPNVAEESYANKGSNDEIYNVTKYPDLYKLLLISDVVISDYSSVGFEAAMIEKPVFIYASDYDEYVKKERNFYFGFEELPFPFAKNNRELFKDIKGYDIKSVKGISRELSERLGINETGRSAEIVADEIIKIVS